MAKGKFLDAYKRAIQHHAPNVPREVSDSLRSVAETQASMATVDIYGSLQDLGGCEGCSFNSGCINCGNYYEPGSLG